MLHIKLKGIEHRAQCKHIFFPEAHTMGSNGQNIFSESSHAAYQIKGNGAWSTMQEHILPLHTSSTCGSGSKIKEIPNVAMLHIKLKGKLID